MLENIIKYQDSINFSISGIQYYGRYVKVANAMRKTMYGDVKET